MALKSSLLWFRRNCRKTSSRFFTSRGPRTIRADFCGDTEASGSARAPWGAPRPLTPAAPKGAQPRPPAQGPPAVALLVGWLRCRISLLKNINSHLFSAQIFSSSQSGSH